MSGSFLRPLLRDAGPNHIIRNTRNGRDLAHELLTAFDSKSRRVGLLPVTIDAMSESLART